MLLDRRMMLESGNGGGNVNEWRLLKTVSEVNLANNTLIVNTDNDGQPFSVDEMYIRVKSVEKNGASYFDVGLGLYKGIGEVRGGNMQEIFIKNIGGFWRCFYIGYTDKYSQNNLMSWGAFHPGYIYTIQEFPKITELRLGFVKNIEAEIYAR